jgi:hypothetical protein
MTQTVWAHGCDVQTDPSAPTALTISDFGAKASASASGSHELRIVIPGPARISNNPIQLSRVFLRYKTSGSASIIAMRLYDCELEIDNFNFNLTSATYVTSAFIANAGTPIPITNGAVAIAIVLNFPSGGHINISGAGFEFI